MVSLVHNMENHGGKPVNLGIKKLTPHRLKDFLDFFDYRAFSDHAEWSFCYCTYLHLDAESEKQVEEEVKADGKKDALRIMLRSRAML